MDIAGTGINRIQVCKNIQDSCFHQRDLGDHLKSRIQPGIFPTGIGVSVVMKTENEPRVRQWSEDVCNTT